ncbi:hypothetical protein [Salinibaculum salinum]|uniref:hypothetical protein n=1 Tax=Salinibaculum salinum TaxID=3131996 RepID=UPI0030EB63E4
MASTFDQVIQCHWGRYLEALRDNDIDTPYDWFTHPKLVKEGDNEDKYPFSTGADPSTEHEAELKKPLTNLSLHTLYRVGPYREQDIAIVGRNPRYSLDELRRDDLEGTPQDEFGQLDSLNEQTATAIGRITGPNWGGWLGGDAVNDGDSWSAYTGLLFEPLEEHGSIPVNNYDEKGDYFIPGGNELPPFLNEFYFTNLFKLPTPIGCGGAPLDDSADPFYSALLREEIEASGVSVIFGLGGPVWEAFRDDAEYVSRAFSDFEHEPDNIDGTVTTVHGALYELSDETYVVPLIHQSAPGESWRYSEYEDVEDRKWRLERSIAHLASMDVI